jgi:hypothetical protein
MLEQYFYTAKDMCRPINASKKQRNCHVKIMIIDDHVAIQGNGNQGTSGFSVGRTSELSECAMQILNPGTILKKLTF